MRSFPFVSKHWPGQKDSAKAGQRKYCEGNTTASPAPCLLLFCTPSSLPDASPHSHDPSIIKHNEQGGKNIENLDWESQHMLGKKLSTQRLYLINHLSSGHFLLFESGTGKFNTSYYGNARGANQGQLIVLTHPPGYIPLPVTSPLTYPTSR